MLKKDGITPRKKGGRQKGSKGRGYNYHSETKAKQAAKRSVRIKEKETEFAYLQTELLQEEKELLLQEEKEFTDPHK